MPAKKKKIIKRRINKADAKRIPKYDNIKPNINLSPFDLANMVQQKFKQDMEADQVRIEKQHAQLEAERKALHSPEIRQLMTDVARLNRMAQLQQRQNQGENLRVELDADATAIGSQEYHDGVVAVKTLEKRTDLTRRQNVALSQMQDAIADKEVIAAQLKGDQVQREQRKTYKKQLDKEANRLAAMDLNVQHLQRMKAIRDKEDEARKLEVASKLRDELAFQYIAEEGEAQANVEMLQLVNQRRRDTMNERINAGVLDAKTKKMEELLPQVSEELAAKELEIQKLQRDAELAEQKQKSLLAYQTRIKQYEQAKSDMLEQLRTIRQDDPNSRITADPSLLEQDLKLLGEERERYEQAHRNAAETLALHRIALAADKEATAIREQLDSTQYGHMFEQLYGKDEGSYVRAVGNLAQLRQGRAALTDRMDEIFPPLAEKLREIERRSEGQAKRGADLTADRARLDEERARFEAERGELLNQLRDTKAIVQRQEQQLAAIQRQYE